MSLRRLGRDRDDLVSDSRVMMLGVVLREEPAMRSARTVGGVAALCGAVVLATGCGGSGGTTGSNGAAQVTSFDVGALHCGGGVTGPVTVKWATENATAVDIAVDSFTATKHGTAGTTTEIVACDRKSHQISITAKNKAGSGETETKDVSVTGL
jgi:hypothetical protein